MYSLERIQDNNTMGIDLLPCTNKISTSGLLQFRIYCLKSVTKNHIQLAQQDCTQCSAEETHKQTSSDQANTN